MTAMIYSRTAGPFSHAIADVTLVRAPWDGETAKPDARPETAPPRGIKSKRNGVTPEGFIAILRAECLSPMLATKERAHGVSHGLAEAGFDIRIRQTVRFVPPDPLAFFNVMATGRGLIARDVHALEAFHGYVEVDGERTLGRFALASSVERFQVPPHLVAIMGHKSTWARRGVNVWAGTTAEPKWEGWLTLEIGFHGLETVTIPAGSGIAQVLFHELAEAGDYGNGKYQGQANMPVPAVMEGEA